MRWLVTGAKGMLGQDLVALLISRGHSVVGIDRDEADITDPTSVAGLAGGFDVVANCAAYTAVDAAEADESTAFAVNAVGPQLLARAAQAAGARMVQISTDYVFSGRADAPYDEGAPIAPRSAYGRTKAAGEWAVRAEAPDHLILRTAWLYGAQGVCFPKTIARIAREKGGVDVVDDQVGQPTWTVDVATLVEALVSGAAAPGTYHATSSGSASWFEFARAVVATAGLDPDIVKPTTSDGSARPAPRPAYSVLAHEALAPGLRIADWADRWAQAGASVLAG